MTGVVAPRLAGLTVPPTDPALWPGHLNRLLAVEIREALANGVLTAAEAEQLLARLVLVIDQAVARTDH
jgi:hypothetical protein